jgi:SAM-dependent methyltransferase
MMSSDKHIKQRGTLREGLAPETFQQFLNDAEYLGWKQALIQYTRQNRLKYHYVVNDSRADWRFLLPLSADSVVLDTGCGWGTIAFPLASQCKLVYALEPIPERLRFMAIRANQDRINNILPIQGILPDLPFGEPMFDLVVMNGVLEWLGLSGDQTVNPVIMQKAALQQIAKVLKPGGHLYVGIENRFGAKYIGGFPDDHTKLRFVTPVPRFAANLISQHRRGEDFRVYTHSFWTLKKLLTQAGFNQINFYNPHPDYKLTNFIFAVDTSDPLQYYYRNMRLSVPQTLKQRLLTFGWKYIFAGWQKYLSASYSVIATK